MKTFTESIAYPTGSEKLFATVGTSLEYLRKFGFVPHHRDATLLDLTPVTKSNGEMIERFGPPAEIVIPFFQSE